MSDSNQKAPNAYVAYMVVTLVSGAASAIIAMVALNRFNQVSDWGMWAITVMVLAPALLGVGVASFIHRTAAKGLIVADRYQDPPSLAQEGHFREGRPFESSGG